MKNLHLLEPLLNVQPSRARALAAWAHGFKDVWLEIGYNTQDTGLGKTVKNYMPQVQKFMIPVKYERVGKQKNTHVMEAQLRQLMDYDDTHDKYTF